MNDGKDDLVRARIGKRVRALSMAGLADYAHLVESREGGPELATMVDLLTTNKTSFWREAAHWDFLVEHVATPAFEEGRPLRIWSAGCSTGEEPYTLGILLLERWGRTAPPDVRILATDLSRPALEVARAARYPAPSLNDVPATLRRRWFRPVSAADGGAAGEVDPRVRALVSFSRLNLMGDWPMQGPFDVILCRNVMIYFDRETRARLVRRFAGLLSPGGFLLVGHSESLNGLDHGLAYVQPAVYGR